jgi:hypothetical protein
MRVDRIRPGQIRLNPQNANDLVSLTRSSANNTQIAEVLSQLVSKYLIPKQKSTPKSDPMEIDHLIRQLLGGERKEGTAARIQLSRGSDEEQVQAARRLGELGDTRAIEPLMFARRNTLSWSPNRSGKGNK